MPANEGGWGWLKPIITYLVLPLSAIFLIYLLVKNALGGGDSEKIIKATAEEIDQMWLEYNEEYKEFLANDGTIDDNERAILDAKLDLVDNAVTNMVNSIPVFDPNYIATLVVLTIAGYYGLKWTAGKLGSVLKEHLDSAKSNIDNPDPNANNESVLESTKHEFKIIFEGAAISEFADEGNLGLASAGLSAQQAAYFTQIVPGIEASYAALVAQLPFLVGNQLAFAQFTLTQYAYYLNYYVAVLPPIILLIPPF